MGTFNETSNELIKLTCEVAFFLNVGELTPVWEYKPLDEAYPTQYIRKVSQHECEIALHAVTYGAGKGRVEVHGNFHLGKNKQFVDIREYVNGERVPLPTITVNSSRGAAAIAKEIQRRFMPAYLPLFNKAIEQRNSSNAFHATAFDNLKMLAAIVHADLSNLRNGEESQEVSFYRSDAAYGEIYASDKSVNLKLSSLTIEQAKRILAIVIEVRQ